MKFKISTRTILHPYVCHESTKFAFSVGPSILFLARSNAPSGAWYRVTPINASVPLTTQRQDLDHGSLLLLLHMVNLTFWRVSEWEKRKVMIIMHHYASGASAANCIPTMQWCTRALSEGIRCLDVLHYLKTGPHWHIVFYSVYNYSKSCIRLCVQW